MYCATWLRRRAAAAPEAGGGRGAPNPRGWRARAAPRRSSPAAETIRARSAGPAATGSPASAAPRPAARGRSRRAPAAAPRGSAARAGPKSLSHQEDAVARADAAPAASAAHASSASPRPARQPRCSAARPSSTPSTAPSSRPRPSQQRARLPATCTYAPAGVRSRPLAARAPPGRRRRGAVGGVNFTATPHVSLRSCTSCRLRLSVASAAAPTEVRSCSCSAKSIPHVCGCLFSASRQPAHVIMPLTARRATKSLIVGGAWLCRGRTSREPL